MPEPLELTLDPDHAPPRVLPGHLQDQTNQRGIERRPTSLAVAERPLAPDELPVPTEDRRRGHDEPTPAVAVDQIRQRRDHHPVPPTQARPGARPLQDRELMTEHQDLSFALARVISCDPEQSAEDEVTEGEEHRRRILGMATRRNDGFRPLQASRVGPLKECSRRAETRKV